MPVTAGNPYLTAAQRVMARAFRQVMALALLAGASIPAQSPSPPRVPIVPGVATPQQAPLDTDGGFNDPAIAERQARMLNIQRQKAMVADTGIILQLARELNADLDSGNPAMSVAERMRKVDEIERLAKSVREKMTDAIGAPAPANPYGPWEPPR